MVLKAVRSRQAFKRAVYAICGTTQPTRGQLREVGQAAARIAGRSRPWGGDHLYVLLHGERWPKYGIHPDLLAAVLKSAGMTTTNGTSSVRVRARHVREGAVVLACSRRCACRRCCVHFVPVTPNRRYCSAECAAWAAAGRRRAERERVGAKCNRHRR